MKKRILAVCAALSIVVALAACGTKVEESYQKDRKAEVYGLNRVVKVYSAGTLVAEYNGQLNITASDVPGGIKFEIDGKRYNIYNATVVVEEK
jgi:hypothetical protein